LADMVVVKIVVLAIHILVSIGLIVAVLLHSGSGGGLSSVLGGAGSSMATGSYIVEKNLDRITIILGGVFTATTLALVFILK
jgi:preprotein translocase subunit SecG